MTIELKMPALSPTMEEGTLAKWLVKEGDEVRSGDILAEIETDKATMEFEAVDEGTITALIIPAGTEGVKVGAVIATLDSDGAAASPAPAARVESAPQPAPAPPSPRREDAAPVLRSDPSVPEGAAMAVLTVREALRDAMAEEMRSDSRVFVMGEEVAEYQGAYKVTQGLLEEFGPQRVIDTPITEYGFAGLGTGAAMGGLRPIVEFITLMPLVIPAIIIVFGYLRLYNTSSWLPMTSSAWATDLLLIFAYATLALPYMYRAVDTGMRAIDARVLTEAAQSLGAGWLTIMLRVILPNVRVALLSGAFLTFAIVIGEFTMASLLNRPAFGPYMQNIGANRAYEPSALAIIAFVVTWACMGLIQLVGRGRRFTA